MRPVYPEKVYLVYFWGVEACPEPVEGKSATINANAGISFSLAA